MGKQTDLISQIDEVTSNKNYSKLSKFASEWVKKRFTPFTIDDIKKAFLGAGNEVSFDPSTWGGLMRKLKDGNLILRNGYTEKVRPNGKKQVVGQWISVEYHQKQSNNATRDKTLELNFDEG